LKPRSSAAFPATGRDLPAAEGHVVEGIGDGNGRVAEALAGQIADVKDLQPAAPASRRPNG
jgi:hypothetical protein